MRRTTNPFFRRIAANPVIHRLLLFFSVFGPATITAMSDNDAGGVATYSVAGATLGFPILFLLVIITPLLGFTQEMGMRLTPGHPPRFGGPDPREIWRKALFIDIWSTRGRQPGHHHRKYRG